MKTRRPLVFAICLLAAPFGAATDSREQMMRDMSYVDEQQCFIAMNSNVVSIMPMLALAWLKAEQAENRQKAREAFHVALSRGCDINAADFAGLAPLHHAIIANDADMVRYLLDNGANPALAIDSREAVFNGLNSFALLDMLEKLDGNVDRKVLRGVLQARKAAQ